MNNFEIIKDQVKLFDVLEDELNLKRSGRVYKAVCPFHDERTPSFTVYPETQTFHCFGCEAAGTVIDYFKHKENIKEPYEVVEYMAQKFNIQIQGFDKEQIEHKKKTVQQNRQKQKTFLKHYTKAHEFLKERGFKGEVTKDVFGVGFNKEEGALVIPFLDTYGNIVGQTYRYFDEDKPKYVNSKEDHVFKKHELLFGLDKARKHIKDKVFIVEGYFDVMALYQMGYKESVAYCGQSLTDGQVQLLSKYMNRKTKIYLIPDNDKTGLKNVAKNINLLRQRVRNPIGVIQLPEGLKDANDVLKLGENIDRFESEHADMFLLKQELDQCLEQKDEYEVAQSFVNRKVQNKMLRAEMAEYLSNRWGQSKSLVYDFMETEQDTFTRTNDIHDFTSINEKFKQNASEGLKGRVFFNWEEPDEIVKGMKRTEVAYLLGRAGAGKTTFVINFIRNLIFNQRKNVIFNSLELDGANIAPQLLQIHLGESEEKITEKVLTGDENLEQVYETLDRHLRVIDRSGQSLKDIEQYAMMCNDNHFDSPVDVIMIDYFSYIKTEGKSTGYEEYSQLAREMKQMAKRLNCLVFVLAQTNRTGKDGSEPLTMDSARDTGAIEESGDYVFGIYRPGAKDNITDEDKRNNPNIDHEYFLQYLKNRWGRKTKSRLWFDPITKQITDWAAWKENVYYSKPKED